MAAGQVVGRQGYSLDEAARFLQYDRDAVRYWLRTGHLIGRRDPSSGEWFVATRDLVAFIRGSNEPMPTGHAGIPREALIGTPAGD